MELLPPTIDVFTLTAGLASVVGAGLSVWAALEASASRRAAEDVRSAFRQFRDRLVAKVVVEETLAKIVKRASAVRRAISQTNMDRAREAARILVEQAQTIAKHLPDPPRNRVQAWADRAPIILSHQDPDILKGAMSQWVEEIPSLVEIVHAHQREHQLRSES